MIRMILKKLSFATLLVIPSLSLSFSFAYADNWVRYQDYKINLVIEKNWRIERDLYGAPIMALGPERNGERAVFTLEHTQLRNFKFDLNVIEKKQNDYYEGRQEWLDTQNDAQLLSKIPFQRLANKSKTEGFQIGFRYRQNDVEYEERSIQFTCNNRMYFAKTLSSDKALAQDKEALAAIIANLDCKNAVASDGPYRPTQWSKVLQEADSMSGNDWPKQNELRKMSAAAKAKAVEALVQFYKKFEEAAGDELYSSKGRPSFINSLLVDPFAQNAFATGSYNCFFGGWPSQYVNRKGRMTCDFPANTNPDYRKAGAQCASKQLACNPTLFGSGICIDVSNAELRGQATRRCDFEFQNLGRKYEDIVKSKDFDEAGFEASVQTASEKCSDDTYLSNNVSLCSVLKDRLVEAKKLGLIEGDIEPISNIVENAAGPNYDKAMSATLDSYKDFEARCFDEKNQYRPHTDPNITAEEYQRCEDDLNAISNDMKNLETDHKNNLKRLDDAEKANLPNAEEIKNESCADCGVPGAIKQKPTAKSACSAKERKAQSPMACAKAMAMSATTMATAIAKSLWSSITSIGELASDAWNWLTGSKKHEDKTGKQARQASKTSDSFLKQLKKDFWGTIRNLGSAIYKAIETFVKEDILCTEWSGVAHFSKCLTPANFSCLGCATIVNGVATVAGYVIGEALPFFLSGGIASGASAFGKFLKGSKAARLVSKIGATVATKFPEFAKGAELVAKGATNATKSGGKILSSLGKAPNKFVKGGAAWLKASKAAKYTGRMISGFKSKFGNFSATLKKLTGLKQSNRAAGAWKKLGNAARFTKKAINPLHHVKFARQKYLQYRSANLSQGLQLAEKAFNKKVIGTAAEVQAKSLATTYVRSKYANFFVNAVQETTALQNKQVDVMTAILPYREKMIENEGVTEKEFQKMAAASGTTVIEIKNRYAELKYVGIQQGIPIKMNESEIRHVIKSEAAKVGFTEKEMAPLVRANAEAANQPSQEAGMP